MMPFAGRRHSMQVSIPLKDGSMTQDFERAAKRALARTGFNLPAIDECFVLLFDSAVWLPMVSSAERWLSDGERHRAERFRFERDRNTYVLAHACWRIAIGVALGIETIYVALAMAPLGQPMLPGSGLATSLSHTNTWVAIAIARTSTVGVDIEYTPTRGALEPLANEICSASEIVDLQRLPASARDGFLLELWTRKEALLKAFGVGLRASLCSVSAGIDKTVLPPSSAPVRTPCNVRNLNLPLNLVGALATPANAVCQWRLSRLDEVQGIDRKFG